jgi:hypothetical protein
MNKMIHRLHHLYKSFVNNHQFVVKLYHKPYHYRFHCAAKYGEKLLVSAETVDHATPFGPSLATFLLRCNVRHDNQAMGIDSRIQIPYPMNRIKIYLFVVGDAECNVDLPIPKSLVYSDELRTLFKLTLSRVNYGMPPCSLVVHNTKLEISCCF